jgi:hypothetical protein
MFVVFLVYLIYISVKNKKAESSWKPEAYPMKNQMRSMMGMGGYGSVLGCEGNKCY